MGHSKIRDTKDYVTRLAFVLDADLLGQPIARPRKRLAAMSLDLLFIALLAKMGAGIMLTFAILLCLRSAFILRTRRNSVWRAATLVFMAMLLLLGGLYPIIVAPNYHAEIMPRGNAPSITGSGDEQYQVSATYNLSELLEYFPSVSKALLDQKQGECGESPVTCWLPVIQKLDSDMAVAGATTDERSRAITELLNEAEVPKDVIASIVTELHMEAGDETTPTAIATPIAAAPVADDDLSVVTAPQYSLIGWIKGIAADLGLSFGFAAIYFTLFTAYWQGQTLGKQLLGIRVVRLDGNRLTWWDAFGRYGGYGAGLATGLLGFCQVFWDANRMAIQDKIAETVVIDLRRLKAHDLIQNQPPQV